MTAIELWLAQAAGRESARKMSRAGLLLAVLEAKRLAAEAAEKGEK